jgi:alpha-beta hydrolase superfamily lysophospholipase
LKNWIVNFEQEKVPYEDILGAYVHLGWYSMYKNVEELVLSSIKDQIAANPNASILITGHSMGGALATFVALDVI